MWKEPAPVSICRSGQRGPGPRWHVWWGNRVIDSSEMYTCLHFLSSTSSSWSSFISPTGLLSARQVSHVLCDFSNLSLTPGLTRCWSRIPQAYVLREQQCEMNARENTTCFMERRGDSARCWIYCRNDKKVHFKGLAGPVQQIGLLLC